MEAPHGEESVADPRADAIVVRGCGVPEPPFRTFVEAVSRPRLSWAGEAATVVGGGAAARVSATGADRFRRVRAAATDLFERVDVRDDLPRAARPRLFGGLAFHDTHSTDGAAAPWSGFPGADFVLPATQLTLTDGEAWLTVASTGAEAPADARRRLERWRERLASLPERAPAGPPGIRHRRPTPDRAAWGQQVRDAVASVRRGDLRKVVIAQALDVDLADTLRVPDVLARLGGTYPDCFRFMFDRADGGTFFGATPERLVSREGRTVRTTALAGSTGRGDTDEEDDWLAAELRDSEKDLHEHELVVEAIRDQLEPLAAGVTTGDRTVRALATVQHLQTPIRATLERDAHVLSLVEALHPTPAVGGLPPDDALRAIRETETFDRGWYAAPVGWLDAAGDGTFAVAIRSAVARGEAATLFAGAGIVADSDPDREWDELQLKYRPILDELE